MFRMRIFYRVFLALSVFLSFLILTGCNGGSSTSSTSSTSSSTSVSGVNYTLPNGLTILSNGAQISTSNSSLLAVPGKTGLSRLFVNGGTSTTNLGLVAVVRDGQEQTPNQNSNLKVTLTNANVSTGATDQTDVKVDAANAPEGNYYVDIIASNYPNSPVVATISVSVSNFNTVKASYLQLDAAGSLSAITASGYASSNIIIFAFANLSSSAVNPSYLSAMQTAINYESSGTINLLSIGGQYATPSVINTATASNIINIVSNEITAYNAQLTNGRITGVDLDLENSIDAATITALAQGFKAKGLLVSTAPQVYSTGGSGSNVVPTSPTNLALTSGGANNQYAAAIAAGDVDYIMVQTYNTGGWTVGGYAENQVQFFESVAQALNYTVESNCTGAVNLCIPSGTKIVIGEVSNGGASGTLNNIYASTGSTSYNQSNILSQLSSQITAMESDTTNYGNIYGVMQWSLNNDYLPSGWNDNYATAGGFSSTIFGATPLPPLPYFILQITNSAPNQANPNAYGSATLVVNGQYWVFGNQWNQPITPLLYQQWGTKPSSQNPATPGVIDSNNLDNLFSAGQPSFTASQILINGYPSNSTNIYSPNAQFPCPAGTNYVFKAGHSYNVQVNAVYQSCAISMVN